MFTPHHPPSPERHPTRTHTPPWTFHIDVLFAPGRLDFGTHPRGYGMYDLEIITDMDIVWRGVKRRYDGPPLVPFKINRRSTTSISTSRRPTLHAPSVYTRLAPTRTPMSTSQTTNMGAFIDPRPTSSGSSYLLVYLDAWLGGLLGWLGMYGVDAMAWYGIRRCSDDG